MLLGGQACYMRVNTLVTRSRNTGVLLGGRRGKTYMLESSLVTLRCRCPLHRVLRSLPHPQGQDSTEGHAIKPSKTHLQTDSAMSLVLNPFYIGPMGDGVKEGRNRSPSRSHRWARDVCPAVMKTYSIIYGNLTIKTPALLISDTTKVVRRQEHDGQHPASPIM